MLKAPFSDSEVNLLNKFQQSGCFHPFTCENGCGDLVATNEGWVCSSCDYTQNWAHEFMLDTKYTCCFNFISSLPEESQSDSGYAQTGSNLS